MIAILVSPRNEMLLLLFPKIFFQNIFYALKMNEVPLFDEIIFSKEFLSKSFLKSRIHFDKDFIALFL